MFATIYGRQDSATKRTTSANKLTRMCFSAKDGSQLSAPSISLFGVRSLCTISYLFIPVLPEHHATRLLFDYLASCLEGTMPCLEDIQRVRLESAYPQADLFDRM
jgi:hypothetical protein